MEILAKENPLCRKNETAARLSAVLFFLTYGAYLILMTARLTTSRSAPLLRAVRYGLWICCLVSLLNILFLCRYTVRQILGILLFAAVGLIVWHQTRRQTYYFFQSMMIVFSARQVPWRQVLKFTFCLFIPLIVLPFVLERLGIFPVVLHYRGTTRRYTLGFSHPNNTGLYLMCFVILWLLLRYEKLKIPDYLAWLALAALAWFGPNSKTATAAILLLTAGALVFRRWGDRLIHCRPVQILCASSFILMGIFSVLASWFYNAESELYVWVDQVLFTGRLHLAQWYLNRYTPALFGQRIKLRGTVASSKTGSRSYILDNFYVRQLVASGVILTILILALFTWLVCRAIRTNDQAMLIVLVMLSFYCIYESYLTRLSCNVLLFQVVYQLFRPAPTGEMQEAGPDPPGGGEQETV